MSSAFKLMNYTTSIPAEKSIMEIKMLLVGFGATAMMEEYAAGKIKSVAFKLGDKSYKLPIYAEGVNKVMFEGKRHKGVNSSIKREDQSYRVAWRIMRDWIHAQLSLVASGQAQPDQVLLPYMWDGKRTLYQAYKDGGLKIEDKRVERVHAEIMEG